MTNYLKTFEFERYKEDDTIKSGRAAKIATNAALGVVRVAVAILTLSSSEWVIAAHATSINHAINTSSTNSSLKQKISHVFQELIGKKTSGTKSEKMELTSLEKMKLTPRYLESLASERYGQKEVIFAFFNLDKEKNKEQSKKWKS